MNNSNSFRSDIAKIDWDFSDLANEGLHTLHWYPATFVSAIPGSLIPLLTDSHALVADPFCGSATTGVEALRLGRRFIGFDTNPIAVLIAKAKLSIPDMRTIEDAFLGHDAILSRAGESPRPAHPNEGILRRWYHPDTYAELDFLLAKVSAIPSAVERGVAQALFSSILKSVSSQGRHWGWVCDNVQPKPEEIQYKDAFEAITAVYHRYRSGLATLVRDMKARGIDAPQDALISRVSVTHSDAVQGLRGLAGRSLDAIVTSPPYYGVADYIKSQRLSFLWFHRAVMDVEGFSTEDFEPLRSSEMGSRSYRHRKSSYDEYVSYMRAFLAECARTLKPGAPMCFVFGESQSRRAPAADLDFIARESGFEVEFSGSRSIRATKRRLMARVPKEEITIYVCR